MDLVSALPGQYVLFLIKYMISLIVEHEAKVLKMKDMHDSAKGVGLANRRDDKCNSMRFEKLPKDGTSTPIG